MNDTIKELSKLLMVLPALTDEVQGCHWNVKGPNFQAVHGDTGAIYGMLVDWTDAIAERIKAIDPSYIVSKGASTGFAPTVSDADVVNRIVVILTSFSLLVKSCISTTDQVTSNQLQELAYEVDKWVWKFSNSRV